MDIKKEYERLWAIKRKIHTKLRTLQEVCNHPLAVKTPHADTGNWCKDDDSYWYEFQCPDCGKFWTTPQKT